MGFQPLAKCTQLGIFVVLVSTDLDPLYRRTCIGSVDLPDIVYTTAVSVSTFCCWDFLSSFVSSFVRLDCGGFVATSEVFLFVCHQSIVACMSSDEFM